MKLTRWLPAALLFVGSGLSAQQVKWACIEKREHALGNLVVHVELVKPARLPNRGQVHIRSLDLYQFAWVSAQGLDLRWDWDDDEDSPTYRYAFVIEPSGEGKYFDFDKGEEREGGRRTAAPVQRYVCRRKPP